MTNESLVAAHLFESSLLFEISDYRNVNFRWEGKNPESILILSPSSIAVLTEDERAMLRRMLNALKLNLENVALSCSAHPPPFHDLKNKITFKKLIAFGMGPLNIGLNINAENYQVINFSDTKIVFSESLSTLSSNEKSKGQLWKALKEMFGMN